MRKFYFLLLTVFFAAIANAQVTVTVTNPTNTTPNLAASYTSLNNAVAALNGITAISGPVILTCTTGTETAPVGGYSINFTATTTAANNIVIDGASSTITAGLQVAGSSIDAIFKIIGGDNITIKNFIMQENAGNTVTATGATNTMTEWGVALLRGSATNGAQNNTIQNNTISLNRNYANSFAIYSDVRHDAATPQTSADITAASGANNGNKVYGNIISNVNNGIVFVGSGTAGFMDTGNDIGGAAAGTGNTLTNWGSNAANSGIFVSVSATNWGIFINQQTGVNVSFNTLTSAVGIVATTFRGIFCDFSVTTPTGTFTNTINNNTVTLNSANTTGTFEAIRSQGISTALSTATINMNSNSILNNVISGASSSSTLVGVVNSSLPGILNMNNNILQGNTSTATTGGFTGVSNTGAVVTTINMNNNQIGNAIGNAITFSAATSGTVLGVNCSGGAITCSTSILNNDFRGIVHSVAGSSTHTYITATGTPLNMTVNNNTFTNLNVNTTGTVTFVLLTYSATTGNGTKTVNGNSIVTAYNKLSASGSILLVSDNGSSVSGTISNCQNNNFSNITVSGTNSITGLNYTDGGTAPTRTVSGNILNNWTAVTGAISAMNFTYWNGSSSLNNNTVTNMTGQSTITGITIGASVNTAILASIANNIITGLSSTGTGGSVTGITCSNTSPTININGNTINTLSSSGASSAVVGITVTAASNTNVYQNTINTLSGSGATSPVANGISVIGGTTVNVYKNKIYDISESGAITTTSPAINGLLFSAGTTVNAYNNLIGDLRAPSASLTDAIRGISITSSSTTTTYNIIDNTVNISATGGANFGTTGIFHTSSTTATTATLNLRNNIIVNSSTPSGTGQTVAYRRSSGAANNLANYANSSNNNLFYAGTPGANNLIYADGGSSAQTITAYRNGVFTAGFLAPRDNVSVSENPPFLSTVGANANFLHINTGIATQVESGGSPVTSPFSITDDYDGNARNANFPDIGADEFTGIASDVTAPGISYTNLANNACTTTRTFSPVTITDPSGVNITAGTRPRVYYKKLANTNAFNDNTSATDGWKFVEATGVGGSPFSFSIDYSLLFGGTGVSTGDFIQYFVVAQDLAATPNVGINSGTFAATPSSVALTAAAFPIGGSINIYNILASTGLSGTVTIGAAGTYTTLSGASGLFSAINTNGLSGNLIANIVDASVTETGANGLNNINYTGCGAAPYTLTIKPNTTATLTGSVGSGAIIKLNGADNVIIDGSNSGGSDRSLTIQNTTATTLGNAVIWIASAAAGDGGSNNTVKNCIIQGNSATTSFMGMYVGGNTASGITLTAAGSENDNNNTINNNLFLKTQYGLALFGYNQNIPDQNNLITNNNFGTANPGEGFSQIGLNSDRQSSLIISNNEIQNVTNTATTNSLYGMRLLDFKNGQAFRNKVHDIFYNQASTGRAYGINVSSSTYTGAGNPSAALIYNNIVYKINSLSTSTIWAASGIVANSGYGDKYYYNSVHMSGQVSGNSSGVASAFANGDGNNTASTTNIDVRDNIFSITGSSSVAGGNFWAYYSAAVTVAGSTLNYNDLYANGTNATNNVGRLNSFNYVTLANWQAATGMEANSIAVDPLFNSTSVLTPLPGSPVVNAGTPIAGITTDILGVVRNVATPTVGAYEQSADITGPTITYTLLANTSCLVDRTLTPVTAVDPAGVNIAAGTRPRLYYRKSTNANTFVDNTSATNGWKYVEATGAGGSPFSFTTNYGLLFGGAPVLGDVIQYFVVAQDLSGTPNVSINSGTFAANPSSVALTAAAFPLAGTINSYTIVATGLTGTVTIGAAGTYTSLSGATGLFNAINTVGLSGNLIANIVDASVTETGAIGLNNIGYNGCAAGPYTLTIKPNTSATLTGSVGAGAIIKLNGADNVVIDGSNSGGTDRSLTIQNTTATAAGNAVIWIASAATGDGASNNTVKNCIIQGNSATTSFMGMYVGGNTASGITLTAAGSENDNNNTINNNLFRKTQYGLALFAYAAATPDLNNVITRNNFGTAVSGEGFSQIALNSDRQSGLTVSDNEVQNVTNTATTNSLYGIRLLDFKNGLAFRNKVHDIFYNQASTGRAYGINVSSSTYTTVANPSNAQIYNNVVYKINSLSTSTIWAASGIVANSGYGDKYYFNSISLTGQISGNSSGVASAFANGDGNNTASTTNIDVRDNIFSITGSSSVAGGNFWAYYSAATTLAGSTLNYNDLYANGTNATNNVGRFNSVNYVTLANWQAGSGMEANSISADPLFNSANSLNPMPGSPAINAGTPIAGITTDILLVSRNVTTPTMGAYEQAVDLGPDIVYTPFANTLCVANRTLVATITDASGVNSSAGTKPRLYYKKSTDANTYAGNTSANNGWKFVEATNAASPFSFTTDYTLLQSAVVSGDVIQYFVVAQDLAGTPNVSINSGTFAAQPSSVALTAAAFPISGTINSYTNLVGLSGTVTIGAAGTYPTITGTGGLFAAINSSGLTGNVTANILDASITETGANALNVVTYGCAGPYTLIIKPGAGVTSTLTGSVASASLIKINGASNVTIDGSNSGSIDQSLTIINTNTTAPTAISVVSLGTGAGATSNTIKNCNISTGVAASIGYGISVGGSTPGTSGADNDNITIQNNNITVAPIGIYANGTASVSVGGDDNLTITRNAVSYNGTLASIGIEVGNSLTSVVSQNTVSETTSASQAPTAISLETGYVSSSVLANTVTAAVTSTTAGYGGRGITIGTGTAASSLTIANNVIYGVGGSSFSGFSNSSAMGIGIGMIGNSSTISTTAGGLNIYHNSIYLTNNSFYTSAVNTAAIYVGSGASALNIRNNAFVNSMTASTAGSKNYAIYCAASNAAFTNINYNDYYGVSSANSTFVVGFLASDQATIAAWRTASGQDVNSISADPLFNSTTNLRPQTGSPLVAAGVTGTGITTDFLGVARGNPPTIGAYEQAGEFAPPTITYTPLSSTLCITNRTISATITDASGVNTAAGTKPRIYFKKSTNANTLGGTNDNTTNGWKFAEATNSSSPFSLTIDNSLIFGGVAAGDNIQYFVVAQDLATTPNVGINSGVFATTPSSVSLAVGNFPITGSINNFSFSAGGLTGTVTIGAAGTYPSLTGAGGLFATLNAGGLTGNLTANILDASVTETGANALNQLSYGCGGPFTLIIKPNTGVTSTLTGALASNALIRILSSNVTVDGSNNGSTSRDLTITNTSATTPSVLAFESSGTTPITSATLKNTNIINGINSATAVVVSDATLGSAGYFNNITIQNNNIQKAYMGIFNIAVVAAGNGSGLNINSNLINTTGANQVRYVGIYVQGVDGAIVSGNNIGNFETISAETKRGIWLATGTTNTTVEKNIIHDINYTGTSGYGAYGVAVSTGLAAANVNVRNNMIFGLSGDGDSFATYGGAFSPVGIYVFGAGQGGVNLYYNTIYLSGNTINFSAAAYSFGILLDNGSAANIKDNIVNNNLGRLSTTGVGAVGIAASTAASQFTSLDYNDYAVNSTGSGTNSIGKIGATDYATLATWQAATSAEVHGLNIQPTYVSATDVHLSPSAQGNWCLNGAGVVIAGITTDIDGDTRSSGVAPNGPDMGADEFIPGGVTATPPSQSICTGTASTTIVLAGAASFTWNRDHTVEVTGMPANGTGNITSAVLTNTTALPVTVTFTIVPSNGTCNGTTITATITVNPNNTITLTSGAGTDAQTVCINTPITNIVYTTTGATGATFSGLPAGVNGTFAASVVTISGTPTASGPFSYTVTLTGGCGNITANGTITVTPNNTITLTSAAGTNAQTVCVNNPIVNITYSTTGATGASFSGLPAGVNGNWAANVVTISGSPSATGTFNYTVTLTGGCGVVTANGSIIVNPRPTIGNVITQPSTCASTDGAINITVAGTPGPYTYSWTTVGGSGVVPNAEDQSNLTVGQYTVVVTDQSSGCTQTATYNLIGPGGCSICPNIGSLVTSPSGAICAGGSVTITASNLTSMGITYGIQFVSSTVALANPYSGGTVIATVPNGSLTSGGTVATAPGTFPTAGSYFIYAILSPTPTDPFCRSYNVVNLDVNPVPTVNAVSSQIVCNGSNTAAVSFSGAVAGATYNWVNSNTAIGLGASGTGTIASFVATNATNGPIAGTITVTPSKTTTTLVKQQFNFTGAMQTWTVPAGVTSVDIETYGGQGADGLTGNPGTSFGGIGGMGGYAKGTLTVVPGQVLNIFVGGKATGNNGGYNGGAFGGAGGAGGGGGASDVRAGGIAPANRVIVAGGGGGGGNGGSFAGAPGPNTSMPGGNGGAGNLQNGSNGANSNGGFGGGGGIGTNGGFAGPGCGGFPAQAGANGTGGNGGNGGHDGNCCSAVRGGGGGGVGTIGCSFNDNGAGGGGAGGDAYTGGVTSPTTSNGVRTGDGIVYISFNTSVTCTGASGNFSITVNPTPNVSVPANATYCNGATVVTGTLNFTSTNTPAGTTTYTWTNSNTAIGLAASGNGQLPTFTATNATNAPISGTIIVTPHYTNAGGGPTCNGATQTFTITVNPTPTVNVVANQVLCNGSNTTAVNFGGNVVGTVFNWTNNTTSIGLAASGSGPIGSFVATNASNVPVTATITVTPSYTNNGVTCTGASTQFTITVNPTPNAVAAPPSQTICSGLPITPIVLSGNVATTVFNWTRNNTVNVTGIAASGSGNITGTLTNTTGVSQTVTFTITPSYTNAGVTCLGAPITATVTVQGFLSIVCPANITVNAAAGTCAATVTFAATVTGSPAPTVTYVPASGSSFPVGTTTVNVTATNSCGTVTCSFTVTVNDVQVPAITVQPANVAACVGSNAVFSVTSTFAASYQWQAWNGTAWVNVPGTNASTFTVNSVTLAMNGNSYRVLITGPCGAVTTSNAATLTVNPLPTITLVASRPPQLLPGQVLTLTAQVSPAGGTFVWRKNGIVIPSSGAVMSGLTVDNVGSYQVTYTDANGCVAVSNTIVVSAMESGNLFVYPVPNFGQFHVRYFNQVNEVMTLNVYDAKGALVYQKKFQTTIPYSSIDVSLGNNPQGSYLVELKNSANVTVGSKWVIVFHQ